MPSFGQLFVSIGANIEGISKGFDDTEKSIKGFARRLDGLGRNFQDLGTRLSLGITAPLAALGGVAVKVAGDFEQTEVAFTTLLGSAEKAGDFLKELEAFAARTPFEFPELTDAAKRLLAFGFEAEQIIPTMTAIGDAAAGLGGGAETIDRVTRALGQIQAKGKASTEELLQLSEVGIGSFKILQEQLGLTGAELEKALRTGAIDAQTAITALLTGISEQFSGQMEKQSQTLLGQISTLKDEFGFIVRDLGTALLPFAKDALNVLKPVVAAIGDIVKAFAEAPAPIRTAGVVFAGLAAAVGPALLAIGTLASSVAGLVPLFTAGGPLAGAFAGFGGILAAVTGPVGIAVAAIAGIGIALYAFRDDIANSRIGEIWSETWENVTASLSQAFDGLTTALGNFTAAFVARWEEGLFGLRPVIEGVWNGIGSIFAGALETISAIVSGGLEIVAGIVNVFAQLLSGNFEGAWEAAKGVFRAALATIVEIVGAQVGAILGIIDGFASALGKSLKLQETFDKEVDGVLKALDRQTTAMQGATKPVAELTKSATDFGKAAEKTEKPTVALAKSFKGLGDESTKTKEKLDDLPPPMRYVIRTEEDLERQTKRIKDEWIALRQEAISPLVEALPEFASKLSDLSAAAQQQVTDFAALSGIFETSQEDIKNLGKETIEVASAYELLGVKAKTTADSQLSAMADAVATIRTEVEAGRRPQEDLTAAIDAYNRAAGAGTQSSGFFGEAIKQVSTIVNDFAKNFSKNFIELITGRGRSEVNRALAEQASEIQASLEQATADLASSLADKEAAYQAYVLSVADAEREISEASSAALSEALGKLRGNLADRLEAYEEFVQDATRKLARTEADIEDSILGKRGDTDRNIADRKKKYDRDVQDARKALDRKRRDINAQIAEELAKGEKANQQRIASLRRSLADEEADFRISQQRRAEDLQFYIAEQERSYQEYAASQQQRLEREREDARISLERRAADHAEYVAEIAAQEAEITEKIRREEEAKLAKLQESFEKQKAEYEQFRIQAVAEYEQLKLESAAKLDELADKHRSFADDLKGLFTGVFSEAGTALTRFVTEFLVGKLFKELRVLLDDLLPSIAKALGGLFGVGGSVASGAGGAAGSAAGGVGGVAGSVGGAGGEAAGGVLSTVSTIIGIVTGIATAIGSIGSFIKSFEIETGLDAIEENTRRGTLYLGDRGDQGILGTQFRIAENSDYVVGNTDEMKLTLWSVLDALKTGVAVAGMAAVVTGNTAIAANTEATATNTAATAITSEQTAFEVPAKVEELGTKLGDVWAETSAQQIERTGQQLAVLAEKIGRSINASLPHPVVGRSRTGGAAAPEERSGLSPEEQAQIRGAFETQNQQQAEIEELRRRNPLAFGSDNPLASILLGGRDPSSFGADIGRGIDLSGLQSEFEAAQQTANNQLDELHRQTAQLEAIQDAIEAQDPQVVVNIQNAYAGNPQEFARMVSKEIEKQLRVNTKGLR